MLKIHTSIKNDSCIHPKMTNVICCIINLNKAGICRRADIYAFGTFVLKNDVVIVEKMEIINEKNNKRGDRGINAHSFGIVHWYVFSAEINNAGEAEQIKVFIDAASQA